GSPYKYADRVMRVGLQSNKNVHLDDGEAGNMRPLWPAPAGDARPVALDRAGRVRDVGRRIPVRPIVDLVREVGPLARIHVCRHIERLLVAERPRLVERHVVPDERRRRADARHPGADVEGLRPPDRRRDLGALAVWAVTLRARGRKYRRAGYGVRFQGRPLLEAVRSLWGRDRDVARQEPQIRDDVAHVGAIGREG